MLKILFITQEVTPFSRQGVPGDLSAALTRALKRTGQEVRVVTPRYKSIRERKYGIRDVTRLNNVRFEFDGGLHPTPVRSGFVPRSKVQVYFLENERFFPYDAAETMTAGKELDSALFLSDASLQLIRHLNWSPDVIYCCGPKAAATPVLLKHHPRYRSGEIQARTLLHSFPLQDNYLLDRRALKLLGVEKRSRGSEEQYLLELAVASADLVITSNSDSVGTIAGIGMERLCLSDDDPASLPGARSVAESHADQLIRMKAARKSAVQSRFGLSSAADQPLVTVWNRGGCPEEAGRLEQLGAVIPDLPMQLLAVSGANSSVQTLTSGWAAAYRGQVASVERVSEADAKLIEAGSDITLFLAESSDRLARSISSLALGAIPVAPRNARGCEPIEEFNSDTGRGNGFAFDPEDHQTVVEALRRALETFRDGETWNELRRRGMDRDYCWENAARSLTRSLEEIIGAARVA